MNAITKIDDGFALQPKTLPEAMELARMLSSSGMVPKNYIGKPEDTLVAMMMGSELGLNPIQSLQNIATINGRPSIYGDALLGLVQSHPAYGGVTETFDENTMTASCTVWRKSGEKHTQTFSQADAVTANLWGKTGPWTQYPKRMLQWRARGFALRDQFADALGGLITVEEAQDMPADAAPKDITPEAEKIQSYPVELFDKNFPAWEKLIQDGTKTPKEIIATVSSKGTLTADQQKKINDCKVLEGELVDENQTKGEPQ